MAAEYALTKLICVFSHFLPLFVTFIELHQDEKGEGKDQVDEEVELVDIAEP